MHQVVNVTNNFQPFLFGFKISLGAFGSKTKKSPSNLLKPQHFNALTMCPLTPSAV